MQGHFLLYMSLLLQVSHSWLVTPVVYQQQCQGRKGTALLVGYEPFPGSNSDAGVDETTNNNKASSRLSDEELEATLGPWDDSKPRFNTIHLTGRVGNDPEPRYFDDGKVVVNLSLAAKRKYHSMERSHLGLSSGDEETDWYGLEIWGQTAEFVSKFVDKGQRVGVIGSLQMDTWIDKASKEPRNRVKVVVRDFDILETRAESEARRANTGSRRGPAFFTSDSDNDGMSGGGPGSGSTGGFFDS